MSEGRIDIHHHVLSPRYIAVRETYGIRTGPGFESALGWTAAASIAAMDAAGIATAILSSVSNWSAFPAELAVTLARDNNEFAAGLRTAYPGRFGLFAAIPMPDVEASLREIEFAFDALHADGISTTTSYGDSWPGDPAFDPVFAELSRRQAVVFVHPQAPSRCRGLTPPVPDATVEFMFDVIRCISSLLFRGTLTRFPDIQFIFTHGGGGLPALADRIDRNTRTQAAVTERLPQGGLAEMQRLHFDLTSTTSRPAIAALRAFVPASQLLFGSDFPFLSPEVTVRGLDRASFDATERSAIDRGNALRLFPRLVQPGPSRYGAASLSE